MTTPTAPLLVAGEWSDGETTVAVHNPATEEVVGQLSWADAATATRAASAAGEAFTDWSRRPARERADLLLAGARLLTERADDLATVLAAEAGKRLPEARAEIGFSAEYLRWFAEEARRPQGHVLTGEDPARRHLTTHRAAGVVASLTSWNFPCSLQARKLAPALAAGCTVVARVSERAPLAVTGMIRALNDAGLPPGVLNLVHGPAQDVTAALLDHEAVRVVTFTGSTTVGRRVMAQAAERLVRPLMELGGDAPFLVFEDADLDAAVEGALLAKTRNTGQSCVAANRFLVAEPVLEEFTARLAARLDELELGDTAGDTVPGLGPMIDRRAADSVTAMVAQATAGGAVERTTTRSLPERGSFVAPALFTEVPVDAALVTEEVFGPVAAVIPFRDEDEAVALANRTEYGLAAYAYTGDASRCWRLTDALHAGIIGINDALPSVAFAPMGGMKQSGIGREGARAGLEEFLEPSYIAWRL